jgi:hypothetical protein
MGSGLEGRLCMLGGLVKGRVGIAGAGRVRMRTCILELDAQEFVSRGLSAPDPTRGPQPLCGYRETFVMMPVDKIS